MATQFSMLALLVLWALCNTPTQAVELPAGASRGSDQQGAALPIPSSFRKLLQEPRIVGGRPAPVGRFPYACSLRRVGIRIHACGGTLIAPEWVLTAAHCMTGSNSLGPTPLVYVGAHGIDDDTYAEVISVVEVIIHESYSGDVGKGFDIALLRLKHPSTKQPAILAQSEQSIGVGQFLATAGWGRVRELGPLPDELQFSDQVQYVSNTSCKRQWAQLQDSMMCTFSSSQSTCNGDSGGPLLIADSKDGTSIADGNPEFDILVGIVSFGPERCDSMKTDVFTRVSSFYLWIQEKMGKMEVVFSSRVPNLSAKEVCAKDCGGSTEDMIFAARFGDTDKVKKLLSEGVDPMARLEGSKNTALHLAASFGHADTVEVLIDAGVDVDAISDFGESALSSGARNNHPAVVELLVKAGADVNAKNGLSFPPLSSAAENGNLDVAKILIEAGATVDLMSSTGATPLMIAAKSNHLKVAKLLLESGAKVHAADDIGLTPLHFAACTGSPKLVMLLLDNGARIDSKDNRGRTALFAAAFCGNDSAMEGLKKAGADVAVTDNSGNTYESKLCSCLDEGAELPCKGGAC